MAVAELKPGDELGPAADGSFRYEVIDVLGAGGFGITYLVTDRRLQGEAVIKELACSEVAFRDSATGQVRPARGQDQTHRKLVERFVKEAQLLNRLRNPHIVRVTDVWEERGTAYYAMDKVDADSYLGAPEADGVTTRSWNAVAVYAAQLLEALDAVHSAGMVHGDVKPANVLLDKKRGVVLIDFGTARDDSEVGRTVTSTSFTRGYAPPELMHPARVREAGPWSDLYSWAMVVWGLVLPHPGEGGKPADAFIRGQSFDPYADASGQLSAAGLPPRWADAIASCLALEPYRRPKSVEELRDRLGLPAASSAESAISSATAFQAPLANASSSVAFCATETQFSESGSTHGSSTIDGYQAPPPPAPTPRTPLRTSPPQRSDAAPAPASNPPASKTTGRIRIALAALLALALAALALHLTRPPADADGNAQAADLPPGPCDACTDSEICDQERCLPAYAADAVAAYRTAIEAWNDHDEATYFGSFEPRMQCFFNRANLSSDELRATRGRHFAFNDGARFEIQTLDIVRADAGGVILRDTGRFVTAEHREKPHVRILLMTRDTNDVFRIAAEVNTLAHDCAPHLVQ